MASGTQTLFGSPTTIVSALKVGTPNGFVANDNGFATKASDCIVELQKDMALISRFDSASNGNVVQCGEIGDVGADTTFTVALGYGGDAASALAAAEGSLAAGFPDREAAYRKGWSDYVDGLRPAPASVSTDTLRRQVYYVAAMALHAAEDKTFRGASVAGFATPWGDFVNGDQPNDGYHRVWGRDLYQQAMGLIAAGNSSQALRMAQFLWNAQFLGATTPGAGRRMRPARFLATALSAGAAERRRRTSAAASSWTRRLFAILLAWMTGLTDNATYQKIKTTADHIVAVGPATPKERWEEQFGRSPSSIAAIIAGLVAAADIARQNGDPASAAGWESTADSWRSSLADWTFTTDGFLGGHRYYERIDPTLDPNGSRRSASRRAASSPTTSRTSAFSISCGSASSLPTTPMCRRRFRRPPPHRTATPRCRSRCPMATSTSTGTITTTTARATATAQGVPPIGPNRYGRLWSVLSGERGEYEIANGRSADIYLQSMADAANDGYFVPEQIFDRSDKVFHGRPADRQRRSAQLG